MQWYLLIVIGLTLGYMIGNCITRQSRKIKGPNSRDIVGKIFGVGDESVMFEPYVVVGPILKVT